MVELHSATPPGAGTKSSAQKQAHSDPGSTKSVGQDFHELLGLANPQEFIPSNDTVDSADVDLNLQTEELIGTSSEFDQVADLTDHEYVFSDLMVAHSEGNAMSFGELGVLGKDRTVILDHFVIEMQPGEHELIEKTDLGGIDGFEPETQISKMFNPSSAGHNRSKSNAGRVSASSNALNISNLFDTGPGKLSARFEPSINSLVFDQVDTSDADASQLINDVEAENVERSKFISVFDPEVRKNAAVQVLVFRDGEKLKVVAKLNEQSDETDNNLQSVIQEVLRARGVFGANVVVSSFKSINSNA